MRSLLFAVVFLATCAELAAAQESVDGINMDDYRRGVFLMLTEKQKALCIGDFKNNMNNPASFQVAGEWFVNEFTLRLSSHQPNRVIAGLPIRGKNGYGGLVKQVLYCYYDYDEHNARLDYRHSLSH